MRKKESTEENEMKLRGNMMKHGGKIAMMINLCHGYYQTNSLIWPRTTMAFYMSIIYSVCTTTSLYLYFIAYYKKEPKYIIPAFSIVAAR